MLVCGWKPPIVVIDLHCHLLPGIDDGATDWDAALAMSRIAVEDGIRICAATPHWTGIDGETEKSLACLAELRERLAAEKLPLEIHSGNEVVLVPQLVAALENDRALPLAKRSYILLETAQLAMGAYIREALFQLQSHGYRIILAHPERVRAWQVRREGLRELVERGCYLQVNAGSLLGDFGPGPARAAEHLLRLGWVSLLATDAHSPTHRAPRLSAAIKRSIRLVGKSAAQVLVEDNPARVLRNEALPRIDAERSEPRGLFGLFR